MLFPLRRDVPTTTVSPTSMVNDVLMTGRLPVAGLRGNAALDLPLLRFDLGLNGFDLVGQPLDLGVRT